MTQSQRLHSTAHKCSTFNTAADVQEDTWLTVAPRSKLSEEGKSISRAVTLRLKTSRTPAPPLSGEEKYSSVISKLTKNS